MENIERIWREAQMDEHYARLNLGDVRSLDLGRDLTPYQCELDRCKARLEQIEVQMDRESKGVR